MKVHEAIAAVMADVRAVAKNQRNSQQNYNFRGVDAIVNAVGPVARAHGLVVVPSKIVDKQVTTVQVGKNHTTMQSVSVTVEYTFYGPEGDSIVAMSVGEAMDSGDKATPKAMSVAYRTCLLQALMLPTDEPDPDEFSYDRASRDAHPANGTTRLAAVPTRFVAADQQSWPTSMTVVQAKEALVAALGSKAKAAAAWGAEFTDTAAGPVPAQQVVDVIDKYRGDA